ncbi:MAG: rod shape-determining protein MreD [Streptosporangiaceae bacterium]
MRGLISLVTVAVTVVFQLTVVDRITFPGGSGPDLVLVVVAALALASGPMAGAVIGFLGGLALDVAPPGSQFTGQDALVFCLIGYACGLLADDTSSDSGTEPGHTALFEIVVTAAGAVCGEALVALLGVMLSDPRVSWPAITRVLPVAVVYDVLLCPFVLYAAAAAWRLAGARSSGARAGWSSARVAAPGSAPGAVSGRVPHLKLGRAASGHSMAGGRGLGRPRGSSGPALGTTRSAGPALRTSRFTRSGLGRSLLGGSVFSHAPAAGLPGRGPAFARSSPLGRSSPLVRSSPLGRSSPLRHRSLFSTKGPFGRKGKLSHRGQLKSPGRGWLRGPARSRSLARRRHPLGRSGPLGPARLHMPRPRARRRWQSRRWRIGGYR